MKSPVLRPASAADPPGSTLPTYCSAGTSAVGLNCMDLVAEGGREGGREGGEGIGREEERE